MHQNNGFDIEDMVQKPTWKQLLLELIDSKTVDPWNVDIVAIADAFMKKIKEVEKPDFALNANVILAAAILLRYKSDYLRYLRYQTEVTDFMPEEPQFGSIGELPALSLASRIPPKRQITIDELVNEMENIIKYENVERALPKIRGGIEEYIDLAFAQEDIEQRMAALLDKIKANTDETGWSLFSRLLEKRDNLEIIYALLSILHLAQKQLIDIRQDELFGEIFIHLSGEEYKQQ